MPEPECAEAIQKLAAKVDELASKIDALVSRDDERLLTVRETAKFLGKTERAVRAMVRRRQLPTVKVGGRIAFRRSEIAPRR